MPQSLPIPYPAGSPGLPDLQQEWGKMMDSILLNPEWRLWLKYMVRWVPKSGPTVGRILDENFHKQSLLQTAPSMCHSLPGDLLRYRGCVMVRDPQHLSRLLDDATHLQVVLQHRNNATVMSRIKYSDNIDTVKRLLKHLIKDKEIDQKSVPF